MQSKKKARAAKKTTIRLITVLLKRDYKLLCQKDPFEAKILLKILEDAESQLPNNWEMALEKSSQVIYKYKIDVKQQTKEAIKHALENYDRPLWTWRGPDEFGAVYEVLKSYYGVEQQ